MNCASCGVSGIVIALSLVMAIPARGENTGTSVAEGAVAVTPTTGDVARGVVDSMTSLQGYSGSFPESFNFTVTPPCWGISSKCNSGLTKKSAVIFYDQPLEGLGTGSVSAVDDGNWQPWQPWHHHHYPSESASMALFGSGLAALGIAIRRRRRLKLR